MEITPQPEDDQKVVAELRAGYRLKDRIKQPKAVRSDLIAAGAPRSQVTEALKAAKQHPSYFEPIFTVSQARFDQLKAQPGPANVYNVRGTQFEAITQEMQDRIIELHWIL